MNRRTFLKNTAYVIFAGGISSQFSLLRADESTFDGLENLAAGKKVLFAPKPSYPTTGRGNTDSTDLTDGKLASRLDMYGDPSAVGWSYDGRANLSVDLEEICDISEIAIRLCVFYEGSVHVNLPGWIEAFVSDDGVHYTKVAEYSRWSTPSFFEGKDSPVNVSESGVYRWSFSDLKNVRGRYVGLRFAGGYRVVSDEMYVFGKRSKSPSAVTKGTPSGFSVTVPQPYFHKPELIIPTNITTPQSLGITTLNSEITKGTLQIEFDLPPNLIWDAPTENITKSTLPNGSMRYLWIRSNPKANRLLTRIYLRASNEVNGKSGVLHYRYRFGNWQSPDLTIPYRVVTVPKTRSPQKILTTLGWWRMSDTVEWPNALSAFEHLGFNAVSLYGSSNAPEWFRSEKDKTTLKEARKRGFKVFGADATYNTMTRQYRDAHPKDGEIFCQFEDGTTGNQLCPSYRGTYYQKEIERFAAQVANANPEFTTQDIEQWRAVGPVDAKRCTRCQADFKASGLTNWNEWVESKGSEMWVEAINAAREKLRQMGKSPNFVTGGYDFEVGKSYTTVFNFDKLYPEYIQFAQPSYYASYFPIDLLKVIEQTKINRQKLPHSDVMPLLTPGDAGPVPGAAFKWSILESYCNGARGVLFWSERNWDAEYLIAYSDAIRAIVPVEDVIIDGELIGDTVSVNEPGHISGMKQGDKMVLLVSDYRHVSDGALNLSIQLKVPSQIRDLESDEVIEKRVGSGRNTINIPLNGEDARILEVSPV